jgi:integrase
MADKLSAAKVKALKVPGDYLDGRGLFLQIRSSTSKSWLLKYSLLKRAREMGLGPAADIPLATARELRDRYCALLKQGIDPIEHRRAERAALAVDRAKSITFEQAATRYIQSNRAGWGNLRHAKQWEATLKAYAFPVLGALPIQEITTALVLRVIEPLWATKPTTASRLRGRLEAIIGAAKARGEYVGENCAVWKGHLDKLLPAPRKVRAVANHAAMAYSAVPSFMTELRAREGIAAAAMEFLVLTAARTGETLGAKWQEIDFKKSVWTIPHTRMKGGRPHQVPLSAPAVAVLKRMEKLRTGEIIFFGQSSGRPLGNMALLVLLRRMNTAVTAHGFRSSFRDWCAEQTNFPSEVAEMALAHAVGNKVEAAYRRGDLLEKRRKLMNAWADYCAKPVPVVKAGENVVAIRAS